MSGRRVCRPMNSFTGNLKLCVCVCVRSETTFRRSHSAGTHTPHFPRQTSRPLYQHSSTLLEAKRPSSTQGPPHPRASLAGHRLYSCASIGSAAPRVLLLYFDPPFSTVSIQIHTENSALVPTEPVNAPSSQPSAGMSEGERQEESS